MERGRLSVRGGREGGNDDEAGTLANTIPSGEKRERTMHAGEKAKKICLGRRWKERRGKAERGRAVLLCPILEALCWRIATCLRPSSAVGIRPLRRRRLRQRSCDSINEMTSIRPSPLRPWSGSHKSPHWAPSILWGLASAQGNRFRPCGCCTTKAIVTDPVPVCTSSGALSIFLYMCLPLPARIGNFCQNLPLKETG